MRKVKQILKGLKGKKALKLLGFTALGVGLAVAAPHILHAFTEPTSGSFAYDVYDVSANKLVKGAVGYTGALALAIWGIVNIAKTEFGPGAAKLGAGGLLAVITHVITTMGMVF